MSGDYSKPEQLRNLTPVTEFGVLVGMGCLLAIGCACLAHLLWKHWSEDIIPYSYVFSWTVFGFYEGWIQFSDKRRMWFWAFGGFLTGICLLFRFTQGNISIAGVIPFLFPGSVEFLAARGARKRPWIWIPATVALYGVATEQANRVGEATRSVMNYLAETLNIPLRFVSSWALELASIFASFLIIRALVASFLAPKETA